MRLTRYHLFLLGGLFLVIMGPLAFTQPGPGTGGKGGKGGKGPNSDFIFMMYSGGNDTFDVSKVQLRERPGGPTADEQRQQMLTSLQKKGVTNGVMTKAVFSEYWEERMTEMRAKWAEKGKQGGGPGGRGGPPGGSQDPEAQAGDLFARMDTDKNGSLSVQEIQAAGRMGQRLFDERDKWDTNKNGSIELPEYIEYTKNRAAERANRGNQNPTPAAVPDPVKPVEEEKRPTVYRTGKLPKDLPSWFEEADKDKDGQVGLYEWKDSGKPVSEFLTMDLNGDGFVTAEEILRYQRATAKATTTKSPLGSLGAAPTDSANASMRQGGGQRGGRNGGGQRGGRNGGRSKGGRPKGG